MYLCIIIFRVLDPRNDLWRNNFVLCANKFNIALFGLKLCCRLLIFIVSCNGKFKLLLLRRGLEAFYGLLIAVNTLQFGFYDESLILGENYRHFLLLFLFKNFRLPFYFLNVRKRKRLFTFFPRGDNDLKRLKFQRKLS